MAIIKGTAQNYQELFDTIHNALVNNGWTIENTEHSTITEMFADDSFSVRDSNSDHRIYVTYKGIGFTENNPPFVRIIYNYNNNTKKIFLGATGIINYNKVTKQYIGRSVWLFYNSFDYQDINYHIVVNTRRICWYMRQNIVTQDFYIGFFLPLCKPTEYAYPYYISASQFTHDGNNDVYISLNHRSTSVRYNSSFTEESERNKSDFNATQGYLVTTSNDWLEVKSTNDDNCAQMIKNTRVRRHSRIGYVANKVNNNTYKDNHTWVFLRSFIVEDDLNMLERIYLVIALARQSANVLGSLDDVYMLYGEQIPDSIITLQDTSKYRVCITNNMKNDFYVLPDNEV